MISRSSATHRRDERNLVIILEGSFAVNVLLIHREGDRASEIAERRIVAAKILPKRADRLRACEQKRA